ncbi:metal ABC transporter solute-binding protein, Zn/Mn family [Sulfurimonas sp.]
MKNLKIILPILWALLVVLYLLISNEKSVPHNNKPIIGVTTFALYDIVKHIANNSVEVVNIIPFGVDPHSFEPTPKIMAKIEKSNVVFYSGAGLEPWVNGFNFKNKAIDISKYVVLRKLDADEFEHHQHHDAQCAHNTIDPHYWLDFANMQRAANVITKELIKINPKYSKEYTAAKENYIVMLKKLDALYRRKLSSCKTNTIVVSHNAAGYLAHKYNFKVESLTGLSPEAEPSAKNIERIFREIKKDGVTTIFFENFSNEKVIQSIAKDAAIELDVFQPLGNITKDEAIAGLTYEDIMLRNLEKISKALMCN